MRSIFALFRRSQPVQPPRVPIEAAIVFRQAVQLAREPASVRTDRELARVLRNLQTLMR